MTKFNLFVIMFIVDNTYYIMKVAYIMIIKINHINEIGALNFDIKDIRDISNVGCELIKYANDESKKPTINLETGEIFSYDSRLITVCERV